MVDAPSVATVALQAGIVLAFLEALRRRNVPAAVNAAVSFGASLVPLAFALATDVGWATTAGTGLSVWVALAGLVHSIGMLGPYDSIRWWDGLTHAISATLVAALVYAAALVALGQGWPTRTATPGVLGVTILLTGAVGVFWELIELVARDVEDRYGVDPVLVHYGRRDTAVDLVVDVGGAVAVLALDVRLFVPLAAQFPGRTRPVLLGVGVIVVLGSALIAAWLQVGVSDPT